MSGTTLLLSYSTLAPRTPLRVSANNSFYLTTASPSTKSLYVLQRKMTSTSLQHTGYMNMSSSIVLIVSAGPWSLIISITLSLSHSQAVLTLKHRENKYTIVSSMSDLLQAGLEKRESSTPELLEESESVLVDAVDDCIVHVPLLSLQHSAVHQLGKVDLRTSDLLYGEIAALSFLKCKLLLLSHVSRYFFCPVWLSHHLVCPLPVLHQAAEPMRPHGPPAGQLAGQHVVLHHAMTSEAIFLIGSSALNSQSSSFFINLS